MMLRNHQWLQKQLDFLLTKYFADLTITSPIEIKFGREAKYRFGSIKLYRNKKQETINSKQKFRVSGLKFKVSSLVRKQPQKSIITITSMFAKETIPSKVVEYTITHELCHYAHGFSSTNKRLFKFPHHGGVVNHELTKRGAHDLIGVYKRWLKTYRQAILKKRIKLSL